MTVSPGSDQPDLEPQAGVRPPSAAQSFEASRLDIYEAWRQIAASPGSIANRRSMASGSGSPVRDNVRSRLAAGTLPRTAGHAWIGAARGDRRCACCGQAIVAPAAEYAVRDRIELHAHAACFKIWVEESGQQSWSGWWAPTGAPPASRARAAESPSDSRNSTSRRWRAP